MTMTILEMAANVRQKKSELDAACTELRELSGEWTGLAIAGEDAMRIAENGLRDCWTMLDRLHGLARAERERLDETRRRG